MKLMKYALGLIAATLVVTTTVEAQRFNKNTDLFLAQFDSKPDPDDIQAIAALGSLLAHPDLAGVDYLAVAGTIGKDAGGKYIHAPQLFNKAFGTKDVDWIDAHGSNTANAKGTQDASIRASAVTKIKDRIKPILQAGGKVWVQEAGSSNVTREWVNALIADPQISATQVKNGVNVVQHSNWNEDRTDFGITTNPTSERTPINSSLRVELNEVKQKVTYIRIGDGNGANNDTPSYNGPKSTNPPYMADILNANHPNAKARDLWQTAMDVIDANNYKPNFSSISFGGVDFSDTVEAWYIFELGAQADNISKFISRYITNGNSNQGTPSSPAPTGGGGANSDTVSTAQLPASVASAASFTVNVPYTATVSRDINVAIVQPGGNPSWRGAGRTTVNPGSGTASVTINVTNPNTNALTAGSYQWVASIRDVGGSFNTNKDQKVGNFTVSSGGGGGASNDTVSTAQLPTSVASAASFTVDVPYTATVSRDINVAIVQPGGNPSWRGAGRTTVNPGSGTASVTINVTNPNTNALTAGSYQWVASIRDVGGSFNTNKDQKVGNFTVTSGGGGGGGASNDTVSTAQLPTSVASAASFTVNVPYTATVARDINVAIIQPGGNPSWRGAGRTTVDPGNGTASITINVTNPNTNALTAGSYRWDVSIRDVGGGFATNKDQKNSNFTVTSAAPQTVNIVPAADVYFQNTTKFNGNSLRAEGNFRTSYLRFNVSGVNGASITGAKLRLVLPTAANGGDNGNGTLTVFKGSGNGAWTEASITSSNVPSQGAQLGSKNATFGFNTTHEIDLTPGEIPQNGNITLILKFSPGDVAFSSKEGVTDPQLIITSQ